jgi:hypothetical protein
MNLYIYNGYYKSLLRLVEEDSEYSVVVQRVNVSEQSSIISLSFNYQ